LGQPIGPIFKIQTVQDSLYRNVGMELHRTLCKRPEERRYTSKTRTALFTNCQQQKVTVSYNGGFKEEPV